MINVSATTANGNYGKYDTVDITVQFSAAVTVTGTPTLGLETGTSDATASYISGSTTDTLTFRYTVAAGNSSADAAAGSIPALRASLNDAISEIEDATATLIDKVRTRCGNKSTVPARTIAWMLNSFSDGFTNSDLKREPLTDEHYLPLLRSILKEHVF